jgi:hypothetical protein
LIIIGAVPVDVKITDCVAGAFRRTFPKGMVVALMFSVGTAAISSMAKLLEMLPARAFNVIAFAETTGDTVALNPALVAFAGTVTTLGTVTAASLLERPMFTPPLDAAALSFIVQASVPAPCIDPIAQERELKGGADAGTSETPFPFKLTTTLLPVNPSVVKVICPVFVPKAFGLKCNSRL